MNRRFFLTQSFAAAAVLSSGPLASAQTSIVSGDAKPAPPAELKRAAPLALDLVREFVVAGHSDLPRVKELLASEPSLINATWDWGAGDWETALGGCSHLGNREIAGYLLNAGARFDLFSAAMLGETELVTTTLRSYPGMARARGPHGFTLLYHVGYNGQVALAETVCRHLAAEQRASTFNQALQSTVASGHTDLTAFLLEQCVDDPNKKNFRGKTPLDVALSKKFDAIAKLLRDHGGVTTS